MPGNERQFSLGDPQIELGQTTVDRTVTTLKELFPNGFTFAHLTGEQFDTLQLDGVLVTDGNHINIFDWDVPQPIGMDYAIGAHEALTKFLKDENPRYFDDCHEMDVWTEFDLASLYRYRKAKNLPTSPTEMKTPVIVFIDRPIDPRDWIKIKQIEINARDIHSVISPTPEELVFWYEEAESYCEEKIKQHIAYMKNEYPELATDEEAAEASPYIRTNLVGSDAGFETADRFIGVMVRNFLVKTAQFKPADL